MNCCCVAAAVVSVRLLMSPLHFSAAASIVRFIAPDRTISDFLIFPASKSGAASFIIPSIPASRNMAIISSSERSVSLLTSFTTSSINAPDCCACLSCHSADGVIFPVFAILRATSFAICSLRISHIPRYPSVKLFRYSGVSIPSPTLPAGTFSAEQAS